LSCDPYTKEGLAGQSLSTCPSVLAGQCLPAGAHENCGKMGTSRRRVPTDAQPHLGQLNRGYSATRTAGSRETNQGESGMWLDLTGPKRRVFMGEDGLAATKLWPPAGAFICCARDISGFLALFPSEYATLFVYPAARPSWRTSVALQRRLGRVQAKRKVSCTDAAAPCRVSRSLFPSPLLRRPRPPAIILSGPKMPRLALCRSPDVFF
jgi:hypothetical protein